MSMLFSDLPPKIKEWLASEELVYIIASLNKKLGLSEEKISIIPRLIFKLVTQQMEPQDFIDGLSNELGVDFPVAKTIAEEIERRALRPIDAELREKTGLEIKLIYYGKPKQPTAGNRQPATRTTLAPKPRFTPPPAPPAPSSLPQQPPTPQPLSSSSEQQQMSPLTFTPTQKEEAAVLPQIVKKAAPPPRPEPPATPFILHQENPTYAPPTPPPPAATRQPQPSAVRQSLTMKVQNYYQSAPMPERTIPKPVSVSIETPAEERMAMKTEHSIPVSPKPVPPQPPKETQSAPLQSSMPPRPATAQPRVVHYTSHRTPLTSIGTPKKDLEQENTVDLRRFAKIDDNAVDLRPKD